MIPQRVLINGKKYYKHSTFTNYAANKNGDVVNVKTGRIMKMSDNGTGYLIFSICDKKLERPKTYLNHRFVFEVFKGPIPKSFEIDHQNNIKADNRLVNLKLLSHKQNIEKSKNKPIISINISSGEKRRFDSIKKAGLELEVNRHNISSICCLRKSHKTAKSNKDGCKYTFKFVN